MSSREKPLVTDSKMKKNVLATNKTFIVGIAFWWTIFVLIPISIFAAQGDWIVTFSITSKVGITFVCLACILLSAKGTFKVVSRGGVTAPIDYEMKMKKKRLYSKENKLLIIGRSFLLGGFGCYYGDLYILYL